CFLYGLLLPMDAIVPYRMEHTVALATTDDQPPNQFWRSILTDALISSVKADDGILIHLSTEEYEHLFDWKRVLREVTVVQPLFYVRNNGGQLKMQAVWAKACRGAMVRYICENKITNPNLLTTFAYEGFEFTPSLLDDRLLKDPTRNALLFTRQ
ncbi:MAG: YaaA family protein, partial [Muribaculaceae bacterium]|nr:YaaA family protein [Muribaculaceae bacterium]